MSIFIVTIKYEGEKEQLGERCDTRRSAAHAAALLSSGVPPDGKRIASIGIVVQPRPTQLVT